MALHTIHSWTLVGLIGAFLDLVLAYFLLCGSALAFFASKFLGVFGLYLPCSCNGFFGFLSSNECLHTLLVDCPKQKIYSVQLSALSRFPFDFNSTWFRDQVCHLNVKLVRGRICTDGVLNLEGEAAFSSCSGPKSHNLVVRDALPRSEMLGIQESRPGAKGKGILNQKQRSVLRRRRRAALEYVGEVSSSPYNDGEITKQMYRSSGSVNTGEDGLHDDGDAPTSIDLGETTLQGFELSGSFDENKDVGRDLLSIDEIVCKARDDLRFAGNESTAIRILEQELEQGQATRDALYLELEKERAAAATAADEAMTMILRLQKDKASIEMEARQYQRMIEEKSAYDEEEMNILKEIIVRRETEKHFLEKELEAYRQMTTAGYEQLEGDLQDKMDKWGQKPSYSLGMGEELALMRQHIDFSEFIGKKEMGENGNQSQNYEDMSVERQGCLDGCNQEFLERKMNTGACQGMTTEAAQTCTTIGKSSCDGEDMEKDREYKNRLGSNFQGSMLDLLPNVHDIHVIDGKTEVWNEKTGLSTCAAALDETRESDHSFGAPGVWSGEVLSNWPCTSRPKADHNALESSLDTSCRSQEMVDSHGKALPFDSRRDSLSAVDKERLKIDSEVECLRERLRILQEGREKLNFSSQHSEGEEVQLKLLEEIAHQLREIRQLSEPGEIVLQGSLLPPSSKVSLKKRRSRSVCREVHESD